MAVPQSVYRQHEGNECQKCVEEPKGSYRVAKLDPRARHVSAVGVGELLNVLRAQTCQ